MNIKQKSNKFRSIVNDMADLYEKKNSNYGDSFGQLFEELGPTAGLVPLWNKLHRATSLIKGDKNNFESLEDTLKDLACSPLPLSASETPLSLRLATMVWVFRNL